MKALFFSAFALTLSAANAFGQAAKPSSTPPGVESGVVKISTNLIRIDVSVTDAKGRAVTDLKQNEIEIYENGVKQEINGFSFVSIPQPKPEENKKGVPKDAVIVPEAPVALRPEQIKRTIALVVDDLTLSFESAAQTRRALKKFVDEQMQDGDLVGIIRTGAGIGALQQFTSNKRQLYAAIERVKWNPKGLGRFGSFDPIEPTMVETLRRGGDANIDPEDLKAEREFIRGTSDFRESVFTAGTLGALKYIVNGMGELPGRKSVIMFSDGLKLLNRSEGSFGASRVLEFLQNLVTEANKKSVIFYPLDARGLVYTGFTAADSVYDPNTQNEGLVPETGRRTVPSISDRLNDRNTELFDSQQGLYYLAKETGGFAYTNKNDLSAGVQKVLEDQSYYLVSYQPDGETFDPEKRKFNKLEVKILRNGVSARHRSGFFVGEEEKRVVVDLNYPTKIMRALTSPFAMNGVTVKLNALFGHSPKTGYFVHSFLHIDASDLTFKKQPNGDYQANFDILAISYGDNGVPVDKNNAVGSITVKADQLERVRREGIAYSFIFPVKQPGAYQLRVAIMDRESTEVGSANQFVEVPNLKKEGITLSGIVLENIPRGGPSTNVSTKAADLPALQDSRFATASRTFSRGTVLRFGVEILNVKANAGTQSDLRVQARVFHDRQLVFQSKETSLDTAAATGTGSLLHNDAIQLGENLLPGDYVLQILVTDNASKKKSVAAQYVQFEVLQ
jgi:VWFA-related protein